MKTRFIILFAIITSGFLISSCATLTDDIEIEAHTDPEINFSAYKTYAWAENAQIVFDPIGQWEQPTLDTDEEVKFAINQELLKRNFILTDEDPDLLVAFAAGVDGSATAIIEKPDSKKKILTNAPKDALIIALIDVDSGYAVWLGYAKTNAQEQQTIENIRTRINFAVNEIFKTYNK